MITAVRVKCLYAVAVMLFCMTMPASAAEAPAQTVLVVQLDEGDQSAVSAELYKSVVARISSHLQAAGFATTQSRGQTTSGVTDAQADRQLLDTLNASNKKGGQQKVDFVALVQILADMSLLTSGTEISVEIRGRMLDVTSRELLAKFNLSLPQTIVAPSDCNRSCVIELLQANTDQIADSLGAVLGQRLNAGNR
jgi:hypothetical protein